MADVRLSWLALEQASANAQISWLALSPSSVSDVKVSWLALSPAASVDAKLSWLALETAAVSDVKLSWLALDSAAANNVAVSWLALDVVTDSLGGAGGIASAESFGRPTLVVSPSLVFTGNGDGYFAAWHKQARSAQQAAQPLRISRAGGIASAEAVGRPVIGLGLRLGGIDAANRTGQPTIRRSFIAQDEEFFILLAA